MPLSVAVLRKTWMAEPCDLAGSWAAAPNFVPGRVEEPRPQILCGDRCPVYEQSVARQGKSHAPAGYESDSGSDVAGVAEDGKCFVVDFERVAAEPERLPWVGSGREELFGDIRAPEAIVIPVGCQGAGEQQKVRNR